MTQKSDPRGPQRTIVTEELVISCEKCNGSCKQVTYAECDHVGHKTAHMVHGVGNKSRCFACGEEERAAMTD
jgi:hypothetical protein